MKEKEEEKEGNDDDGEVRLAKKVNDETRER
jgi:hypothetical protein